MRMRFMVMGELLLDGGIFENFNATELNDKILNAYLLNLITFRGSTIINGEVVYENKEVEFVLE
ncbi:hypothetical protein [Viridibacillus arvi]|uniref:Uncharacterized protein n=1 Tax=Viridibacillus arvi TaxID=263475 RepID=A0A0M0LL38_9BACL|nr:hypothetical protein [Viridibacillus arvi]KOO51711.1 hypothetical protein AMD00_04455 [Viridibacillus arvi]